METMIVERTMPLGHIPCAPSSGETAMDFETWISHLNEQLSQEGIGHFNRPIIAIQRYSIDFKVAIAFDSATAKRIFHWFETSSKPGVHAVGPKFRSAYWFDAEFWEVDIPIFFGSIKLDPIEALHGMPPNVLSRLKESLSFKEYALHWADCLDYTYGFDFISKTAAYKSSGAFDLLCAGNEEIKSAIALALELRPNARCAMSSRMSIEMHMKWCLAHEFNFGEKELRNIGHNLQSAVEQITHKANDPTFRSVANGIETLPQISDRYEALAKIGLPAMWSGLSSAHRVAAWITRRHSPYNVRRDVEQKISLWS